MGCAVSHDKIPVSAVIVTKNEEPRIARCIEALQDFDEIVVVDSRSDDRTCDLARLAGARVVDYVWDGQYPKKRGWCLAHLDLAHEWVFFIDADEVATPAFIAALRKLDLSDEAAGQKRVMGYFVKGLYVVPDAAGGGTRILRHGLSNHKLCLIDRRAMEFPVVDDLDIAGMGEIEGHYQPVVKAGYGAGYVADIKAPILHYALEDEAAWESRHERYATWERGMNARGAWPKDPVAWREALKSAFRGLKKMRPFIAFMHSYILKAGFLDGRWGYDFARRRARYYALISSEH